MGLCLTRGKKEDYVNGSKLFATETRSHNVLKLLSSCIYLIPEIVNDFCNTEHHLCDTQ